MLKTLFGRLILIYLRVLAKIQLLKVKPTIIGITGTAGKTSTRNATAAALKDEFQTKVSYKANSETGIPLNILGLTARNYSVLDWLRLVLMAPIKLLTNWRQFDKYVVEMAIDSPFEPKNMSYLLKIIQPEVGVFLNASPMHSLEFDQLVAETDPRLRNQEITRLIAQEKGKLILSLPANGWAVLNHDDKNVIQFQQQTQAKTITFGSKSKADVHIKHYQASLQGTKFIFELDHPHFTRASQQIEFKHYLLPAHFGQTFAAAAAVGLSQGLSFQQSLLNLKKNFSLPPGRSSLIPAKSGAYILDSSYNASAEPLLDFLELLDQVAPNRKLALLGDIRELGEETKPEHTKVAVKAAQVCQLVVLVGSLMKKYALPVIEHSQTEVRWFVSADQAADFLQHKLQADDLLLVKGSQNTLLLEIAVEQLMLKPELANEMLCRRGRYWGQRRTELLQKNTKSQQ